MIVIIYQWLYPNCYIHNVSADASFNLFWCFLWDLGAYAELQTEPIFNPQREDCFNSFNPNRVQVLNYSKYSFLFLPIVSIESVTSRWFCLSNPVD